MISRLYVLCAGLTLVLATLAAFFLARINRPRTKARTSPSTRSVAFAWMGYGFMGDGPHVSVFRLRPGESADSIPFASRLCIRPGKAIRIRRAPELDSIPLPAGEDTLTYSLQYLTVCDIGAVSYDPIFGLDADDRVAIADAAQSIERDVFGPFMSGSLLVHGERQESPEYGSFLALSGS